MSAISGGYDVVRRVVSEASEQEITFLAASIAYYAFVSLLPMLLLALAIATAVAGEAVAEQVAVAASEHLSPTGQNQLEEIILNQEGRAGAIGVGTIVLLWSTLKVFRGLDEAFSRVYNATEPESFLETVKDALTVLATIAVGVGAMVLASLLLRFIPNVPFAGTLSTIALALALLPVFLPLYYFFPDVGVSVREAIPGALVATVGWTLLQIGFRIYVRESSRFDAYGVLGGALVLVTWLYFGAILVLLGAVVNAVLTGRYRDGEEDEEDGKRYLQERRRRLQRTEGAE